MQKKLVVENEVDCGQEKGMIHHSTSDRPGPGAYTPDDRTRSGRHGGAGTLGKSWHGVMPGDGGRETGCESGRSRGVDATAGGWMRHLLGKDLTRRGEGVGGVDTEPLSGAWIVLGGVWWLKVGVASASLMSAQSCRTTQSESPVESWREICPAKKCRLQSAFVPSPWSTPSHCRSDGMCFEVLGVFFCQLEFLTNEIRSTRSGDRVDSGTRLISTLGCGEKIRPSTEVGLMGLRAQDPAPPRDASFLGVGETPKHLSRKRDGACIFAPAAPSLLSPPCPVHDAPDPIDQFRILCRNL